MATVNSPPDTGISTMALTMTVAHLNSFRILDDPDLQPIDLTNTIHPIFQSGNWRHTPPNIYQAIAPALRLASRFITERDFIDWWIKAALGNEVTDPATNRVYLSHCAANHENRQDTRYILTLLARYVHFDFMAQATQVNSYERLEVPAVTRRDDDPNELKFGARGSTFKVWEQLGLTALVMLHGEFYDFFATVGQTTPSAALVQRVQFNLAQTLVHELAHALDLMRFANIEEAYYDLDDYLAERGEAWENFAFRCRIEENDDHPSTGAPPLMSVIPRWGMSATQWAYAPAGRWYIAIPMIWINQWFLTETWNKIQREGKSSIRQPYSRLHARRLLNDQGWRLDVKPSHVATVIRYL